MTPIIDIVFLLIIFFMVICRFIEAENFPVTVPDDCKFASNSENEAGETTVTVMKTADNTSSFAVGSEKIAGSNYSKVTERIAELIDIHLKNLPDDRRIVTLRIDKDVCFSHAQYALAGVAASSAKNIQLAILREKRAPAE